MKESIKQNCPLCDKPATYTLVDAGNRKYFSCNNCTLFQISLAAERKVNSAPSNWKEACSMRAKSAPAGKALEIIVPSKMPNADLEAIQATYASLSDLPQ